MGNRYCMNCGMPIPHNAKICPECGTALNESDSQKEQAKSGPVNLSKEQPEKIPAHNEPKPDRQKYPVSKRALAFGIGFVIVFGCIIFFIPSLSRAVDNALSRQRENQMMDSQHSEKTPRQEISIPDMSMPEISIPDIQLPEPPAAAFAVESYEIETTPDGETLLYVNVSYTNKSEDDECFMTNYFVSVQQDGEACQKTAVRSGRENHQMDSVKPDETILTTTAFIISAEKETTVAVGAYFADENYLEETILPHADGTVSVSE